MADAPIRQAVILVGGLGTRLGTLTRETPKPLLDVAGKPFLHYLLSELRRQGVEDILLLAGFRAHRMGEVPEVFPEVSVVVEPEPLGTGGALRFAADRLDERFFFLNGDSLFDVNLWDLAGGLDDGALAILSLRPVPDVSRYGPAILEDERITHFAERTPEGGPGLINGGVAALHRDILRRIPAEGIVSIERDVYPDLAAEGLLRGRAYDRPFIDIGVPEDFDRGQTVVPEMLRRGAVLFRAVPDAIAAVPAVKAVNEAGLLALVSGDEVDLARLNFDLRRHGAQLDGVAASIEAVRARGDVDLGRVGEVLNAETKSAQAMAAQLKG